MASEPTLSLMASLADRTPANEYSHPPCPLPGFKFNVQIALLCSDFHVNASSIGVHVEWGSMSSFTQNTEEAHNNNGRRSLSSR
ncbi:hypothetical protein BDN70DRAFT_938913 [Pholiota conissans]|uniref:Uncharacterized protein n=1 Tax=Pholiota conissans TaxID=109636 RepID=A0A9P5YPU0_9AGAR|nr:hypothetical protein BDN70DRAFT_938913 [Pholiota conissans]